MNKFFQKAISDIKKQKEKEKEKEPVVSKTDDKECELSSDEEKRLKDLGALKSKPIHKEEKEVRKWKHDKYIPKESQKSANSTLEERTIYFYDGSHYDEIYAVVKPWKIYIREIDSKRIVFNSKEGFIEASKALYSANIAFKLGKASYQSKYIKRNSIFDRFQ